MRVEVVYTGPKKLMTWELTSHFTTFKVLAFETLNIYEDGR